MLAANGDAVNGDPKQPSALIEFTRSGRFVSQSNIDASQGGAFGLAVATGGDDAAGLALVDDVSIALTVYRGLRPN